MDKDKINNFLNVIKYVLMISFILSLAYVFFFANNNFCIEAKSDTIDGIEQMDQGKRCFSSIGEANNYSSYLIEKYDIGKNPYLDDDFLLGNITFNIS